MPLPATYNGMLCPNKLSFGRVHGTQPAVGTLEFDGTVQFPLGSVNSIQIGAATYVGMVIRNEEVFSTQNVESTSKIVMVDWRDRLHDTHVFFAINIQDNDGRFYHIWPGANWTQQKKTYINRELEQADWDEVQRGTVATWETLGEVGLISAYTLLNYFADAYNFIWTASPLAYQILERSRPENLNWNSGTRVIEAINSLLAKNNLRLTVLGVNQMHITIRGFTESAFVNPFLAGVADICSIGANSGTRGQELNAKGSRAIVIGDRNKHQFNFICHPTWNSAWTMKFCFDGWTLNGLLIKNELTLFSMVSEMPEIYQDTTELPDGTMRRNVELQTRNDLTIQEYLDQIAWKVYVVNAGAAITQRAVDRTSLSAIYRLVDRDTFAFGDEDKTYNDIANLPIATRRFTGPLSSNLIDLSNRQFVTYCTEKLMVQGQSKTFSEVQTFTAQQSGAKLEVIPHYDSAEEEWHVLVTFNETKTYIDPDDDPADLSNFVPDRVICKLAVEGELFNHAKGAGIGALRVREQRRRVSNLYRAFIEGNEVSVLRLNFQGQLRAIGQNAAQPVTAPDIAERIATQMLFQEAITQSGNIKYSERAGTVCDGIIESVTVSWTPQAGIKETANLTSDEQNDDFPVFFTMIDQNRKLRTDEDIEIEMITKIALDTMKNKGQTAGTAGQPEAKSKPQVGGRDHAAMLHTNIGREGLVTVNASAAVVASQGTIETGQPMIVRGPIA